MSSAFRPLGHFIERHSDGILAISTVLTVVVLFLQFAILYKTDETSRLRDRAFIYLGDPPNGPYPAQGSAVVWYAGIVVGNAGNVPARRVKIRFACPDMPHGNATDPWPVAKWENAEVANVIGPKQGIALQGCNIPIESFNAAKKLERDLYVLIEATYLDGFYLDELRTTQMSRLFRFDQWGGQSLGFSGAHNCTDEDCLK